MFVVIVKRVVKHNTGDREKFAPRSSNQEELHVSGPFLSLKAAQRAVLTALSTHTCLAAQAWSAAQIADSAAKYLGDEMREVMRCAERILDSAK